MSNATVNKSAAELQDLGLPHLTISDLPKDAQQTLSKSDLPSNVVADYLSYYTPNNGCPNCGGSHIRWGIWHGVALCTDCTYPFRVYHFIGQGDDKIRIEYPAPVHPENIEDAN
jgi:hypothetical protein